MRTLRVRVKPNARSAEVEEAADGTFVVRVKAPPVDGKANAELIEVVAAHLGVRKTQVSIKSGASARLKLVQIDD